MLLTLIEKADFLVDEALNALMAVLPDKDTLLLTVDSILSALGIQETAGIEKIFHHLTHSDDKKPTKDTSKYNAEVISNAEKRSKLVTILWEYVEEPEAEERLYQKQQAMFGTFNILQSVASTIQPDKEGHLWDELKESIDVFKSPDRAHLKKLLTEYKDVLVGRSDLMKRNNALRKQNAEFRLMLKNYLEGKNDDIQ